jgi:TRAP-type uncharacterized transport system substrate-binding protein
MPAEVVYEIVKIFYENRSKFAETHISGKFISRETIGMMGVPVNRVHPGALKYYEEEGVQIGAIGEVGKAEWGKLP